MLRYAQVGLGIRSWMYSIGIVNRYPERAQLVALCDSNPGRLAQRVDWAKRNGVDVPFSAPDELDELIRRTRPDVVIVTTPDFDHDSSIVRAMQLGCDVITEKPLTIDAERLRRILEARRRTGRSCRVTFNYRYSPVRSQVKQILASGAIGEIHAVDFQWLLDTTHGADYFRRWHRNKRCSGGLLVHKATHHFDLVNWWLDSVPVRVSALGRRDYYTPENARALGLARPGERCLDCAEAERCPMRLDLRAHGLLDAMYRKHEQHDGYFRDRCVFSPEIDIEDRMDVRVDYRSGARMSYSLSAASPWEGYRIAFLGSRGRLEHVCRETVYVSGDGGVPGRIEQEHTTISLQPHFKVPIEIPVASAEGGHGGGDEGLLRDLFAPDDARDALGRRADERAGAWSVLTGIAANRSIAEGGRSIDVGELAAAAGGVDLP